MAAMGRERTHAPNKRSLFDHLVGAQGKASYSVFGIRLLRPYLKWRVT